MTDIQWAWRRMVADAGTTRVSALAGELGFSRRHFGKRFAENVGVTPKQAVRLMRFERGRDLLRGGYHGTLATLAGELGYYDQAHLTNEWQQFAGCTPGEWMREELPFLQATDTEPGAESSA